MKIVAISGVSGAGKSSVAKSLEDEGFFVVDNLPSQLLEQAVQLIVDTHNESQVAFVIDVREANFLKEFPPCWDRLKKAGHDTSLLFLNASDDVIVNRFKETRRRHPLESGLGLRKSITQERVLLSEIAFLADQVLNTDTMTSQKLGEWTRSHLVAQGQHVLELTLLSFGFKYGLPIEVDICLDARFIENPYFVPELRALSGLDAVVSEFVLSRPEASGFLLRVKQLLEYLIPLYQKEGKAYLTVAIACTGGRHRSPALIEKLQSELSFPALRIRTVHRDIEKAHFKS